jgi:FkbM family methyltransferase
MVNWTFIREVGPMRWIKRYSTLQFNKRVLRCDSKLLLPTGSKITLPRQSRTSTEIYVTNANMDWGAEALFARFADRHRDFLDIGSHIGYYAAYLSPLVRRAYAFEPDEKNFSGLRENACLAKNIEVVEMAVSYRDGIADFFTGESSSVGSLNNHGGRAVKVPVTTIDTFIKTRPNINVKLIKTDIEGHDLEALRGMELTVAKFQPLILTECELSPELDYVCSQWKYRIFAFFKAQKSLQKQFREYTSSSRGKYRAKMLFLVPENMHSDFVNLSDY